LTVQRTVDGSAAVANPPESTLISESNSKRRSRYRQPFTPEPVMVTVFWWQTDNGRTACMENQFSPAAATPLRFRCLGTNSSKYPKRYRVDLAQALDPMPELDRRELKALGSAIAVTLSSQLGVEVAACSPDVIDSVLGGA
jgi:hypothetical protein